MPGPSAPTTAQRPAAIGARPTSAGDHSQPNMDSWRAVAAIGKVPGTARSTRDSTEATGWPAWSASTIDTAPPPAGLTHTRSFVAPVACSRLPTRRMADQAPPRRRRRGRSRATRRRGPPGADRTDRPGNRPPRRGSPRRTPLRPGAMRPAARGTPARKPGRLLASLSYRPSTATGSAPAGRPFGEPGGSGPPPTGSAPRLHAASTGRRGCRASNTPSPAGHQSHLAPRPRPGPEPCRAPAAPAEPRRVSSSSRRQPTSSPGPDGQFDEARTGKQDRPADHVIGQPRVGACRTAGRSARRCPNRPAVSTPPTHRVPRSAHSPARGHPAGSWTACMSTSVQ